MKTRNLFTISLLTILFSGCVIWSFYPFYTQKDLFENDLLTGNWIDGDSVQWVFSHPETEKDGVKATDRTAYNLRFTENTGVISGFNVHLFKLEGYYFLDFYLDEIKNPGSKGGGQDIELWTLHVMPVHTVAKLTIDDNGMKINWYDKGWLEDLLKEKKVKIRHENDGNSLLLTSQTKELQKLIVKHAGDSAAFQKGLEVTLKRSH